MLGGPAVAFSEVHLHNQTPLARVTEPLAPAVLQGIGRIPTPFICDGLKDAQCTTELRPFHKRATIVGTAFTVQTTPGDNLMVHVALERAAPGDIIVIDGAGHDGAALVGEMMMLWAMQRGLGGFVVDGAIRDVEAYESHAFPCFARCVSPRGPTRHGPGRVNVPVTAGGMLVHPGDVIVGDADGLVSFSPDKAGFVMETSLAKLEQEQRDKASIAAGHYDRPWLDRFLLENGL